MKKDESPKINIVKEKGNVKNVIKIPGQKSQPLRPFTGCDTCKLKNNISLKKSKMVQEEQEKIKKNAENNQNLSKTKIKLTDLCEEDKKRIVELMEELSKFAEKNRSLKESLDFSEKAKKEQYECLMKQTNLHLEEKNLFLKEIQTCKAKLEVYESEMKDKITAWEAREKHMDSEIRYLAKALQKSFNEKSELMKEISHLKTCLKQSLESFELLRNEVTTLQHLSKNSAKRKPSSRCVTEVEENRNIPAPRESEDEYLSAAKERPPNKDGLDVINNKLEQLYGLLQKRTESSDRVLQEVKNGTEPETGIAESKNDPEDKEQNFADSLNRNGSDKEGGGTKTTDTSYKFLKPFNEYNKTSVQAERILKNIEKPFCFGYEVKLEKDDTKSNEGPKIEKVPQKTDVFDEDRLLSELFYSESNVLYY